MKNFLVLCVTIVLAYLGYDALYPPLPPLPAPVAVTPAPTAVPKVYFHSALDAPAMTTSMTSGASYFSTEPNSRFVPSYGYGTSGYVASGPTYIVVPGGRAAAATGTSASPLTAATAQAQQIQRLYYRRPEPVGPTPTPTYQAH